MNTDYTVLTLDQFLVWLDKLKLNRKITWMAWHHTYKPNTADVLRWGFAHYVKSVQRVHIGRGWQDQAQHININNADGTIIIGRNWEIDGGGIKNDPRGDITIEIFADYDSELMSAAAEKTIIAIAVACSRKFGIPLSEKGHKYHNWFDLNTGKELLDGQAGSRKTCPGKNFFGGFTRKSFNANFLPKLNKFAKSYDLKKENEAIINFLVKYKFVNTPNYWVDVLDENVVPNYNYINQLFSNITKQKNADLSLEWFVRRDIITSPVYWKNVFEGKTQVNVAWLRLLLTRTAKLFG